MFFRSRTRGRPVHHGPFPLETLAHDDSIVARELARSAGATAIPAAAMPTGADLLDPLAAIAREYAALYARLAIRPAAERRAPVPADLERRAADIKGLGYFLDAAHVGIARLPAGDRVALGDRDAADADAAAPNADLCAVVLLVEHGRVPEHGNRARVWVAPAVREVGDMRAAEIAAVVAGHIRQMGWPATFHFGAGSAVDLERLAVLAGIAVRAGERLESPYVGARFSLAAVVTSYGLAVDRPLAADSLARARGLAYWLGVNGAQSGRERNRQQRRATHLSRYPMEQVTRVARPTTLILDDEVPRVPKRAAFFERALQGDLGAKAQRERTNFAFKHPSSRSLLEAIRVLVPHQDGPVAARTDEYADADANAEAIKSLAYFLGADLTGVCEIPAYAWYSHKEDGTPIVPYHRYAVVMLIDQGFDTMEGASGDDWISASQSMRGYLRGAEIAGIMSALLRQLGYPARAHTNADSDVQHIPLLLWAGLGELSRIGELVLNPFVGPRFKSVVLTTDLPLAVDRPIDFGLQYFCNHCRKCARECPCDAISAGPSVMFNGYEMWKLDVERCTRYRLTNSRGAACGRCMKTCPLNKVVDSDGPLIPRAASWLGIHARRLKPLLVPAAAWLDDRLGNGRRNLAKKWWLDHEIVDGVTVAPKATNEREIDATRKLNPDEQRIAYYPASAMPAPNAAGPRPLDRRAALAAGAHLETPAAARARVAAGGPRPDQYVPTPPEATAGAGTGDAAARRASPYAESDARNNEDRGR